MTVIRSPISPVIFSPLRAPTALYKGGGDATRNLIAAGDDGFAIDFVTGRMRVQDAGTSANNFVGPLASNSVVAGTLATGADGSYLDASNFIRFAVADWPYSNTRITIAGQIKFATETDATQRTIFSVDTGGNDRLMFASFANANDLTLSMGLGGSAFNLSTTTDVIAADTWLDFIAVAGPLGAYIAVGGTVLVSTANVLAANAAPPAFNGIGGDAANLSGGVNSQPVKANMRHLVVLSRPIAKDVALAGLPFGLSLAAIGDSLTDGIVAGVVDDYALVYPALLNSRLSRIVSAINAGDQGSTTAKMYGNRADIAADGTPDVVIIYGGTNDLGRATTVAASPTPTDTIFTVASNITFYAVGAKIFVDGEAATILSISSSQITLTAPLAGGAPTAGDAVTIDTQGNLELLATYAGNIGCDKVMIAGMHYFNWTSGGDTTSSERASNVTLRGYQEAAATATGAVYVDLYEFMRQIILAGTYTQGDWAAWHSSLNNQHLNANGQSILADAFEAAMRAEGWI